MTKDLEERQHHLKAEGLKDNIDNHATPALLQWLPGVFLLAVIGVGAWATLLTPSVWQWPSDKDVITGEAMLDYEKNHLDAEVRWRDPSVTLWGTLNYHLFGEARDGAIIGKDGWLFTTEEFQTAEADGAEIQNNVAYIKQVRDELGRDGTELVVALIPSKARVYADRLPLRVPAHNKPIYQRVRNELEAAGIPAPDLHTALTEASKPAAPVFLRTDTHWTPFGAGAAARALSQSIQALELDLPPAEYDLAHRPAVQRRGDLMRYVPVRDPQGPRPDIVREPEYTRTDQGSGLLGDDSLAVTLVGTSYSAETKDNVWHFAEALGRELRTEVLNAASEGQGPMVPMRRYLKSQERREYPPQVVVWEIPERFLRVPYGP